MNFPICNKCGHPYCPDCGKPIGQLGSASCVPNKVDPHPTAYYWVEGGRTPDDVVMEFNRHAYADYLHLMGAQVGWWLDGFSQTGMGACVLNGWRDGILIRVPKKWLTIPLAQLNVLPARAHLVRADGKTPWQPVLFSNRRTNLVKL